MSPIKQITQIKQMDLQSEEALCQELLKQVSVLEKWVVDLLNDPYWRSILAQYDFGSLRHVFVYQGPDVTLYLSEIVSDIESMTLMTTAMPVVYQEAVKRYVIESIEAKIVALVKLLRRLKWLNVKSEPQWLQIRQSVAHHLDHQKEALAKMLAHLDQALADGDQRMRYGNYPIGSTEQQALIQKQLKLHAKKATLERELFSVTERLRLESRVLGL
jgi:hypothetical protein